MSIHALWLEGWDALSTWGAEDDYFYAQLTRNGRSDADGPEMWITPGNFPVIRTAGELSTVIARATGAELAVVRRAMAEGLRPSDREKLGFTDAD